MIRFQEVHQKSPDDPRLSENLPRFRRAMFTVGLLVRYFDFSKEQLYEGLQVIKKMFSAQWLGTKT